MDKAEIVSRVRLLATLVERGDIDDIALDAPGWAGRAAPSAPAPVANTLPVGTLPGTPGIAASRTPGTPGTPLSPGAVRDTRAPLALSGHPVEYYVEQVIDKVLAGAGSIDFSDMDERWAVVGACLEFVNRSLARWVADGAPAAHPAVDIAERFFGGDSLAQPLFEIVLLGGLLAAHTDDTLEFGSTRAFSRVVLLALQILCRLWCLEKDLCAHLSGRKQRPDAANALSASASAAQPRSIATMGERLLLYPKIVEAVVTIASATDAVEPVAQLTALNLVHFMSDAPSSAGDRPTPDTGVAPRLVGILQQSGKMDAIVHGFVSLLGSSDAAPELHAKLLDFLVAGTQPKNAAHGVHLAHHILGIVPAPFSGLVHIVPGMGLTILAAYVDLFAQATANPDASVLLVSHPALPSWCPARLVPAHTATKLYALLHNVITHPFSSDAAHAYLHDDCAFYERHAACLPLWPSADASTPSSPNPFAPAVPLDTPPPVDLLVASASAMSSLSVALNVFFRRSDALSALRLMHLLAAPPDDNASPRPRILDLLPPVNADLDARALVVKAWRSLVFVMFSHRPDHPHPPHFSHLAVDILVQILPLSEESPVIANYFSESLTVLVNAMGPATPPRLHRLLQLFFDKAVAAHDTTMRGNVYAALTSFIDKCLLSASTAHDASSSSSSSASSFALAIRDHLDALLPIVCRDALAGSLAWRTVAFSTLATLTALCDSAPTTLRKLLSLLTQRGFLRTFVHALKDLDQDLLKADASPDSPLALTPLYLYEAQTGFLVRVAQSRAGAQILDDAQLFDVLASSSFLAHIAYPRNATPIALDVAPDPLLDQPAELSQIQHDVLLPTLRLIAAVCLSLDASPPSALHLVLTLHASLVHILLSAATEPFSIRAIDEASLILLALLYILPRTDGSTNTALINAMSRLHKTILLLAPKFLIEPAQPPHGPLSLELATPIFLPLSHAWAPYFLSVSEEDRSDAASPPLHLLARNRFDERVAVVVQSLQKYLLLYFALTARDQSILAFATSHALPLVLHTARAAALALPALASASAALPAADPSAPAYADQVDVYFSFIELALIVFSRHRMQTPLLENDAALGPYLSLASTLRNIALPSQVASEFRSQLAFIGALAR